MEPNSDEGNNASAFLEVLAFLSGLYVNFFPTPFVMISNLL
jgi:hypothetical protein